MSTPNIPYDAPPPIKDAFRAVWKRLSSQDLQRKDLDIHGHKITNAGDGRVGSDYVTLRQLRDISNDQDVATQVRIITEAAGPGPWTDTGAVVQLTTPTSRVSIGISGAPPSTTPKVHIRQAAAASFPTLGAQDYFVLENSGNTNIAIITGATSSGTIKWFGSGDASADGVVQYNRNTQAMTFETATTAKVRITSAGSVLLAVPGALATNATDGFTYIPSCAGTPTGTPTAQTGMIPIVYDSTNHILYAFSGGSWRTH